MSLKEFDDNIAKCAICNKPVPRDEFALLPFSYMVVHESCKSESMRKASQICGV